MSCNLMCENSVYGEVVTRKEVVAILDHLER
jgi:hypothetical protein